MLELLQAALLGVVQGLTEFLPVSSSGHLLLAQQFLGVDQERFGLPFDAAIQSGTLLAVVSFFWRDFLGMARALLRPARRAGAAEDPDRRMAFLILAATVPAGIFGFFFEDVLAGPTVRSPWVVVFNLVLVGALFLVAEAAGGKDRGMEKLGFTGALAVGLAQASALVPGVSRSGATIAMGLFLGLRREEAARFSFLMSVPIIAIAAGFSLAKAIVGGMDAHEAVIFGLGIASSAAVGYLAIRFLLGFLRHHGLTVFAIYRFALAAVVAVALLA
ncbi:undecaprenyl-diphosphatase UppP [Rubrobacter tropicus]|uniref:undecaprenyl-diphosphatase UppP n=1 Tax=Rubrobacter tropicus TaxID=2653851 RepID=UPI00140B6D0F|nr:undecaprenyl-diphosphatase UppP [Rubrobacter tropicus]